VIRIIATHVLTPRGHQFPMFQVPDGVSWESAIDDARARLARVGIRVPIGPRSFRQFTLPLDTLEQASAFLQPFADRAVAARTEENN
jgi:hypothetical protein